MRSLAPTLLSTLALTLAGCGGDGLVLDEQQASQAAPKVQLLHAKAAINFAASQTGGIGYAYAYGYVLVENIAYHKEVVVHHTAGSGWSDVAATYVGPADGNREVWYFRTPDASFSPRLSAEFQFAVRYTVARQTYWDNNGGRDYRLGVGPRPIHPHLTLPAQPLVLDQLTASTNGTFWGQVALKNLAYDKKVTIVFTTDGWKTVRTLPAAYMNSSSGSLESPESLETWMFKGDLPSGATKLELAISYEVNGATWWDNNFRRNYAVSVPGGIDAVGF